MTFSIPSQVQDDFLWTSNLFFLLLLVVGSNIHLQIIKQLKVTKITSAYICVTSNFFILCLLSAPKHKIDNNKVLLNGDFYSFSEKQRVEYSQHSKRRRTEKNILISDSRSSRDRQSRYDFHHSQNSIFHCCCKLWNIHRYCVLRLCVSMCSL